MNKKQTISAAQYRQMIKSAAGNQKVRNAQKSVRAGVKFDSKLEMYMYDLLTLHKIPFDFQVKYILQDGFSYGGKKIRPITYTVDFFLQEHDMIIDTKGVLTQQGLLRIKMLMHYFVGQGIKTAIRTPRNRQECEALIAQIKTHDK